MTEQFPAPEPAPEPTTDPAVEPTTEPAAAYRPGPETVVRRGARPTTIVWGLILVIIGGALIVSQLVNVHIQAGTALIGLLGLAGLLLVVGAAIGAIRGRAERPDPAE